MEVILIDAIAEGNVGNTALGKRTDRNRGWGRRACRRPPRHDWRIGKKQGSYYRFCLIRESAMQVHDDDLRGTRFATNA